VIGQRLLAVGDAHLGAGPPAHQAAFLEFLEAAPDLGDSLLVTGDLFDFWFAWERVIPRAGFAVAAALGRLRERMPIVMTGGNHDRWGDEFWHRDLGIDFHPNQTRFAAAGREVLAVHGDGITERHWSASLLQRITSHRATIALFGALHPSIGFWIADTMNHGLGNTVVDPAVLDAAAIRQREWATSRLAAEPGLGLVIMGHTHRHAAVEVAPGRWYLNPGAWLDGYRYAVCDGSGVTLKSFTPTGSAFRVPPMDGGA